MIQIGKTADGQAIGFSLPTLIESRLLIQSNSGGYKNNLGHLRSMGAIDYPSPNAARATELLFPEALT